MPLRLSLGFTLLLLTAGSALAQALPGPPRTPPPSDDASTAGTAIIRGRATLAATGEPVRRLVVRINGQQLGLGRVAVTDDEGRYELKRLPPGTFQLTATKAGLVVVKSAQLTRIEQPRPITVHDGEVLEKVDFKLLPGGIVTGRIVDDKGEAVAGASMQMARPRYVNGRRALVAAAHAQTDDRGEFRIYGIPPGEYYLTASSALPFGDSDNGVDYLKTYFPGTATQAEASRVQVAPGQELAGLSFSLLRGRLARITGVVRSSDNRPGFREVLAFSKDGDIGSHSGQVARDGTFVVPGLRPGTYRLRVVDFINDDGASTSREVVVGTEDVGGVALTIGPGVKARGRVIFDPPSPDARPTDVRIIAADDDRHEQARTGLPPAANPDGTFELSGLSGHQMIMAMVFDPTPWLSKSVQVAGVDVTDTGIDFREQDVEGIEIVMSQKHTNLTGTATDESGQPVTDAAVVVFADNPSQWGPYTRYIGMDRPDQTGRYTIRALPAGEYRAIAIDDFEEGEERDRDVLGAWRERGTRFDLSDGESKTLDLRVKSRLSVR
jgi:protocatechuate 3,4-dioxygenase beta subunit